MTMTYQVVRVRLTLDDPPGAFRVVVGRLPVVIGRADPKSMILPEVDLSAYDAYRKGISRVHAHIFSRDGVKLWLEDQNSTNGTFLNEERLAPYVAQALKTGDIIRVGRIRLVVRLEEQAED